MTHGGKRRRGALPALTPEQDGGKAKALGSKLSRVAARNGREVPTF